MQKKFDELIKKHEILLEKDNKSFNLIGYFKLALVIFFGISVYFAFTREFSANLIAVSTAILFAIIILSIYHSRLHKSVDYLKGIIAANKRHLDRITGKWSEFADIGSEFIDTDHAYACDLDIIGQKSLFQFLNITNTWHGRQSFAHDLLNSCYSDDEICSRQEAIAELSHDIEFINHAEYHFSKIKSDDSIQNLVDELKDNRRFIKNKFIKYILVYAPALTIILNLAMLVFQIRVLYPAGVTLIFAQAFIWAVTMLKTHGYLRTIHSIPYKLRAYGEAVIILKEKEFTSSKLKNIQAKLGASDLSAVQAIKELDKISARLSAKNAGLIWFILNILWLWDFECAVLYEKWKSKYSHAAENWFLALGEFESLLCFSILPNVCGSACLPVPVTGKTFTAKDIGHPLILNDTRVNNNVSCDNSIFIISGSNMSGKTTFLRTVGINLVLARAGSFVCAKQMSFKRMDIMTSMRIADDLNEGISTFYAELRRIKAILERAKADSNIIFLIDEMFRGTNSADRLIGAETVISKLNELSVIGMITTHDLDLCELADQFAGIKNYSFAEQYKDRKILFDYKIKSGKSTTTNAKYLMEMLDIL